jgi:hypothetical protein
VLGFLARTFLLRRLLGARRPPPRRGLGRRPARRSGFGMFGPVPTYSRTTRRGSRVSVGGCCLPIPLSLGMVALLLGRLAARR